MVQEGKIDIKSLQQLSMCFMLPSTETAGNWLLITADYTKEFTPPEYRSFMDKHPKA